MIREETARNIAICYREIANANTLLEEMQKELEKTGSPDIRDAFGRKQTLQLGVPSGRGGHRIFNVNPKMSVKVIEAHIEEQREQLKKLNALAMIESREINAVIKDNSGKVFVIENADKPERMDLLKNTSGETVFFDSEEEAREKVLYMDPIQPVQFVRVNI